jgi:hypothetical protein
MSRSQHPAALSVQRLVRGPTGLLALVMALPLIDGLFPAIVLAGGLDDPVGILEVGLLIFGGSATLAVIIAEMDGTVRDQVKAVLIVGVPLIALAAIEAALAPTLAEVLNLVIFERFAAVVILAVAARTASARIGEYIPRPGVVVGLGLLASLDPAGASLTIQTDPGLVASAAAAAGVGVTFALGVAITAPWLRNAVDLDRFRFGSAVALGVLPLSIFGIIPGNAPLALAVLGITALFAFDPSRATEAEWEFQPDEIDITAAMADGGEGDETSRKRRLQALADAAEGEGDGEEDPPAPSGDPAVERLPWL